MPITVHDDFVVLQFPLQRILDGQVNIFSDYQETVSRFLPDRTPAYPPLYYYISASFRALGNMFSKVLPEWMEHCWDVFRHFDPSLDNSDYFSEPGTWQTYRNLFLFKLHYLLLDLFIGLLLFRLASNSQEGLLVFALWMLNPFTLHSVFAHGQYDLLPTTCCLLALYFLWRSPRGVGMLLLSAGALIKIFPAFFLLPALILVGKDKKDALKLIFWAAVPVLFFLPTPFRQ